MNLENMPMGIIENILQNRGRATIYACDDPVKTLAVGLDGKRVKKSARCSMSLRRAKYSVDCFNLSTVFLPYYCVLAKM